MGKKRFFEPWIPLKITLLSLAFLCMSAMADEPGVTFLFSNGQKVSFTFTSEPEIVVGNDGITISYSNSNSLSFTFADVQRFYFEENIETGIHDVNAGSAAGPAFGYNNGVITVCGLKAKESVSVYSIGGSKVCETKAGSDGCASVDISGAVGGVYVISTGSGVSFKLFQK